MKKVVIDTNVFISGLLRGRSTRQIILALKDRKFKLITSKYLINELIYVLREPRISRIISIDLAKELLNLIIEEAKIVSPRIKLSACRDSKDNMVLECALNQADFIVTGDKDLLILNPFQKISIITPREFLIIIKKFK